MERPLIILSKGTQLTHTHHTEDKIHTQKLLLFAGCLLLILGGPFEKDVRAQLLRILTDACGFVVFPLSVTLEKLSLIAFPHRTSHHKQQQQHQGLAMLSGNSAFKHPHAQLRRSHASAVCMQLPVGI